MGQYFNIESYRDEKASSVILISYTRIIFSTVLGFLFFNEKVSFIALFGILIVLSQGSAVAPFIYTIF